MRLTYHSELVHFDHKFLLIPEHVRQSALVLLGRHEYTNRAPTLLVIAIIGDDSVSEVGVIHMGESGEDRAARREI